MIDNDQPIKDVSYVGKVNKIKILDLIRDRGEISRSEISNEIGLSLPTVSRLVESLIHKERLIQPIGIRTTVRGRPPNLVTFAGDHNFVIGMSIGRMHISAVLTNLHTEVLAQEKIPTNAEQGFQSIVKRSAKLIHSLMKKSNRHQNNVLGVGVAVGGLIDIQKNHIAYSATLNWKNKDFAGALSQAIHRPVILDHDVRVMAHGELEFGIGNRIQNFICVLLGYGIGSSFIINGKPFYGKCGMTGELGHIKVSQSKKLRCSCGNYGCLETMASGRAIAIRAQEGFSHLKKNNILYSLCQGDPSTISAETVAKAAQQGDSYSRKILLNAADYIGSGLAALVNLFNPEAIVLGGGLMHAGPFMVERIQSVVQKHALTRIAQDVIIQPATLGDRSRIMGSVALILKEILNLNLPTFPDHQKVNTDSH